MLHDAIEDQGGEQVRRQIAAMFGPGVEEIVVALSDSVTEDPEIKTVALTRKGVSVDDRADILAGDKVKVVDVIGELVDRDDVRADFDVIGMMLPTFPFRTPAHVREGFEGLSRDFDAALSFMPYDFSPQSAVTFDAAGAMQTLYNPS